MKKPLLLIFISILSYSATAQKMKVVSGNLKGLKHQASFGIKFVYDSLLVGENVPEDKYLLAMEQRWEGKERGKGRIFLKAWFDDRKKKYEPAFIKNFQQHAGVMLNGKETPYMLLLKTKHVEGGWNAEVVGRNAEIAGELWFVESADNSKVIAKIEFYDAQGDYGGGGDADMTKRIESAYAKAGKWLGIFFIRKSK